MSCNSSQCVIPGEHYTKLRARRSVRDWRGRCTESSQTRREDFIDSSDQALSPARVQRRCHKVRGSRADLSLQRRSAANGRGFPLHHRFGSECPQGRSGDEMTLYVESIVDGGMEVQEALRRSGRLEALHLPLAASDGLM